MFGLFFYAQILIGIYIVWRVIYPLPTSMSFRLFLAIVTMAVSMLLVVEQRVLGREFVSSQPMIFSWVAGYAYTAFILLGMLTLLSDIGYLIKRWVFRRPRMWGQHWRLGLLVVTAILTIVGVHQATKVPDIHRVEIKIDHLPEALDGFTIVQLTDLHVSFMVREAWLRQVVDKTNALHPDVILLTGDMIDGFVYDRLNDVAPLAELKAAYGVYGVTGNHEYYYDAPAWVKHFRKLGITMLENQHIMLDYQHTPIKIVGVNDIAALQFGLEGADIEKALTHRVSPQSSTLTSSQSSHAAEETAEHITTILMDHRPINARQNIAKGVDLQLSGHTHGGSVWGLTEIVKLVNNGFVSGLYAIGQQWLYLSNGAGLWNGFPVRLGVPSEISVIVLKK